MTKTVLMTADTAGGVFTYSVELARALGEYDIHVLLYTMGGAASPEQRAAVFQLDNAELMETTHKLEWMQDPWHDVEEAGRELMAIARERAPDLVHLNNYVHGALKWDVPVMVVGHSCVLSWWNAVKAEEAPAEWDEYKRRVAEGLRGADLVIAPTRAMLEQLSRYYRPLPPCAVIPNGTDGSGFAPGRKQKWILTAGRLWDQAKNASLMREVARRLPWRVYAAGSGECATGENFFPIGSQPRREIARWFAAASIYALPALYEPFGLSVLEAALSGCALMLSDIDSLRENWEGAAIFVDPRKPAQAEAALNELIHDDEWREYLQQAAVKRARGLSSAKMARAYSAAYDRLAESRRYACVS